MSVFEQAAAAAKSAATARSTASGAGITFTETPAETATRTAAAAAKCLAGRHDDRLRDGLNLAGCRNGRGVAWCEVLLVAMA
jgi:hypothetical protein